MNQYPYVYGQDGQHANSSPYPARPSYGASSQGPQFDSLSDRAQNTYEYNRSVIPGLAFGTPANTSSITPHATTGQQQPWPVQGLQVPTNHQSHGGYGVPYGQSQQPSAGPQYSPPAGSPYNPSDGPREEGELSDGELEDLYGPQPTEARDGLGIAVGPPTGAGPSSEESGQSISYASSGEESQREIIRGEGASRGPSASYNAGRERTGSYSPYLSPREVHNGSRDPEQEEGQHPGDLAASNDGIHGRWSPKHAMDERHQPAPANELPPTSTHHGPPLANAKTLALATSPDPSFGAMADTKKRATAAILNLWPLEVRYKNYLDEGIDENVVKALFKELGLDTTLAAPADSQPTPPSQPEQQAPQQLAAKTDKPQPTNPTAPLNMTIPASKENGATADPSEERKDRIKRLLALKAAEPKPAAAPAAAPASSSTGTPLPAGTSQIKKRVDSNLLLQQKMEALQKRRALITSSGGGVTPASQDQSGSPTRADTNSATAISTAQPTRDTPNEAHPDLATNVGAPPRTSSPASGLLIPGLFLSGSQATPVNQRKRPVAMDFVDPVIPPRKRPFSQSRPQSRERLIIDISDASDDEDIEMDMGSPTDATPHPAQRPELPKSTSSFRDRPPLSDSYPRPYSNPASTSNTPPQAQPAQNKVKQELEQKIKEMLEMKKRIAEAEARKKLKKSSTGPSREARAKSNGPALEENSGSSNTSTLRRVQSTEPTALNESAAQNANETGQTMLPMSTKTRESEAGSKVERRLRITSQSLPTVEANIQAKTSKLRLLQSEVARLEKEVQDDLTEKKRLTDELDTLENEIDGMVQQQSTPSSSEQTVAIRNQHGPEIPGPTSGQRLIVSPAETGSYVNGPAKESSTDEPATVVPNPQPGGAGIPSPDLPTDSRSPAADGQEDSMELEKQTDSNLSEIANAVTATTVQADEPPRGSDTLQMSGQISGPSNAMVTTSATPGLSVAGQFELNVAMPHDAKLSPNKEASHEPAPAAARDSGLSSPETPPFSPAPADEPVPLDASDTDLQAAGEASPLPEQISAGANDSAVDGGDAAPREVQAAKQAQPGFVPYESPLQYFHAFRFHPSFTDTVHGGLRSLTYSHKIDANLPICPNQLAGQGCPKGDDCEYQHFESMTVPDDQILLQLGANASFDGDQKQEYINGLRDVLYDFRTRKVKDFKTIAEGIIAYRRRFTGDSSKILPLGGVNV